MYPRHWLSMWLTACCAASAPAIPPDFDLAYTDQGYAELQIWPSGTLSLNFGRDKETRLFHFVAKERRTWEKLGIVEQKGWACVSASATNRDLLVMLPDGNGLLFSLADEPRQIAGVPLVDGFEVGVRELNLEELALAYEELDSEIVTAEDAERGLGCQAGGTHSCSCSYQGCSVSCAQGSYACCTGVPPPPGKKCAYCIPSASGGCVNPR